METNYRSDHCSYVQLDINTMEHVIPYYKHTHTRVRAHVRFMALRTLTGITQVIWYQKCKTNLDFTQARDSE